MGKSDFSGSPKQRLLPISQIAPTGGSGTIRDLSPTWWFSPLAPVKPSAPASYRPRQYAYTPGANILWQPKGESGISFETLRALADSWDLYRIISETQKDRISAKKFEVRAKSKSGESKKDRKQRNADDPTVQALNNFLAHPDGFHPFRKWLRMILEDMFVIDAVAIYLQRDLKGKIASLMPLAGETINRQYTEQGVTPPPPYVAYQQVVYGTVACNLTTDDLVYSMRNERTHRRYGFSIVEQILITISIALRRQEFQLQEYTSGNMPEAITFLPHDLPIDKVKEIQDWFDSNYAGNLARRRRLTFLPGLGVGTEAKPNIIFPKQPLLKDEMDDWLAKVVAYNVGVSAQPFLKMMNRASAEQAQDTSEEEGQEPIELEVQDILNEIIQVKMGFDGYEVVRPEHRELDPLKQAQADDILVGKIRTVNEIREDRGDDPRPEPEADMLGVFTATGFTPLGQATQPTDPSSDGVKPNGKPKDKKPTKVIGSHVVRSLPTGPVQQVGFTASTVSEPRVGSVYLDLEKARTHPGKAKLQHGTLTHNSQEAKSKLAEVLTRSFNKMSVKTLKVLGPRLVKVTKASTDPEDLVAQVLRELLAIFEDIPQDAEPALESAVLSGVAQGMIQVDVQDDQALVSKVNTVARDWASDRAAELVGMSWDTDGNLVANPDAEMTITEATRDKIRSIVSSAFEQDNVSMRDLSAMIQDSGVFSEVRADLIANTEVSRAQTLGNVELWQRSGLVEKVQWFTSEDEGVCDECDQNDQAIVTLGEAFPSGAESPADTHPNCRCILAVAELVEETQ